MKGGESELQVAGCRGAVGLGKNPFRGVDEDEAGGSAKQGIASAANIGGMTGVHAVLFHKPYGRCQNLLDLAAAVDNDVGNLARIMGRGGVCGQSKDFFQKSVVNSGRLKIPYGATRLQQFCRSLF